MTVATVNREDWQIQVLVWLPSIHRIGQMMAYSIEPAPIPTRHSDFMTVNPDQEWIILVSHSGSTHLSWITLLASLSPVR